MEAKNWKTTVGGLALAIGAALIAYGLVEVGGSVQAFGATLLGFGARDRDVTSEGTRAPRRS